MHPCRRLFDGLVGELQLAVAGHLVGRRVWHPHIVHHGALVLTDALLAQRFVVAHAEHVDGLVVLSAWALCHYDWVSCCSGLELQ